MMEQNNELKVTQEDALASDVGSQGEGAVTEWLAEKIWTISGYAGGFRGEFEVKATWHPTLMRFKCSGARYKITREIPGGNSANINWYIQSATRAGHDSGDNLKQDGNWHVYQPVLEVAAVLDGTAFISVTFIFDRSDGADPSYTSSTSVFLFEDTPEITSSGHYSTLRPIIAGRGSKGATVHLMKPVVETPYGRGIVRQDGRWSSQVSILSVGHQQIVCRQSFGGFISGYSNIADVFLTPEKPIIIHPASGKTVRIENLFFEGRCETYSNIMVVRANPWLNLSDRQLENSLWWKRSLLAGLLLPTGNLTIQAQSIHSDLPPDYSQPVTFRVESYPLIATPPPITEQPQSFTITGSGGVYGAWIEVFPDGQAGPVYGSAQVTQQSGRWSVTVSNIPPGGRGVVVEQVQNNVRSGRGVPRLFKIKPPQVLLTVDVDNNGTVTIKGTGHIGAQLTIRREGNETPIDSFTVTATSWTKSYPDWLPSPAPYTLVARQSVGDNAGGLIYSDWSAPAYVTVTVPPPGLNVEVSPNGVPRFYGTGKNWPGQPASRVEVRLQGATDPIVPIVEVVDGIWSSLATGPWNPGTRYVQACQHFKGLVSEKTKSIPVEIPLLPPTIDRFVENALSPHIHGRCLPGAVINLMYSDETTWRQFPDDGHGNWHFRRDTGFDPGYTHTVCVKQTFDKKTSSTVSRTFTVPLHKPVITHPKQDDEVGRDIIVRGGGGVADATMQLRDAQFDRPLGEPTLLTGDAWSIELKGLAFDKNTIDAQQTLGTRKSVRSDPCVFTVVLMPPAFRVPEPGAHLPRTSTLSGTAMPGARVTVWLQGNTQPLLEDVPVNPAGFWESQVTLEVGAKTLWARQTFEGRDSKDSDLLSYSVVPAAPFIETPVQGQHIGRTVVVSGFGYPGDTVTVMLEDQTPSILGTGAVLEDRSWSVSTVFDQPGGPYGLVAVASHEGFASAQSAPQSVVLSPYSPTIDEPGAGRWVGNPVGFAGQGRYGIGQLVSWFNPEHVWLRDIPVTTGGWQSQTVSPLPPGGNWCRFKQTIVDGADASTVSDWGESDRFEVLAPKPD